MQDHIGMICTEHCIDDLFTLCGKCFLTEQNIDWYNKTNQKIQDLTDKIDDPNRQVWHHFINLG